MSNSGQEEETAGVLDEASLQSCRIRAEMLVTACNQSESQLRQTWLCPLPAIRRDDLSETASAAAQLIYRLALASSFELLLAKLELVVTTSASFPWLDKDRSAACVSDCIDYTLVFTDLINNHTRFTAYPHQYLQRIADAFTKIVLLFVSYLELVYDRKLQPQASSSDLEECSAALIALTLFLYRHPSVRINTEEPLLAWRPPFGIAPVIHDSKFQMVSAYHTIMPKHHFLLTYIRFTKKRQAPSSTLTASTCCLALGVLVPPDLRSEWPLERWEAAQQLPDARQRLNWLGASEYFEQQSVTWIDVCVTCGLYKRAKDSKTPRYKLCGGCAMSQYCSKECQRKHWTGGHREACSKICLKDSGS